MIEIIILCTLEMNIMFINTGNYIFVIEKHLMCGSRVMEYHIHFSKYIFIFILVIIRNLRVLQYVSLQSRKIVYCNCFAVD